MTDESYRERHHDEPTDDELTAADVDPVPPLPAAVAEVLANLELSEIMIRALAERYGHSGGRYEQGEYLARNKGTIRELDEVLNGPTGPPGVRIDGLGDGLVPGYHAMTFSGVEFPLGAVQPVIRFRYAGRLADDAMSLDDLRKRLHSGETTPSEAQAEVMRAYPPELHDGPSLASQAEAVNVRKLARVIAVMMRNGYFSAPMIGMPLDPGSEEGWDSQVEKWLRS